MLESKLSGFSSIYFNLNGLATHMGTLTILFGFTFMILGTAILAKPSFYLSENLEAAGILSSADEDINDSTPRRRKSSMRRVIFKILASMVTMSMLWWAIFTGIKLSTQSRNNQYHLLTVSVGVITVIFGSIYFVIGVTIIADISTVFLQM